MMNLSLATSFLLLFAVVGGAQGETRPPLEAVSEMDLHRYLGTWYEIARLPNRFQSQCAGDVTATYSLFDDGDIRIVNRCRTENGQMDEAEGRAKQARADGPNTKLKVRFAPAFLSFLPFVWGDYWIIELAPDYSYAAVGEPTRKFLWILARTPAMDETTLQKILDQVKGKGYDLTGLIRTQQSGR
ncbi:lipocalin family protein [bacterium]|nr:lipocalin family protein [bacterium]MBU1985033.1 lipocalin family protein [bacterium]